MSTAIRVTNVSKTFRIPLDRSTTLKYRVVHWRSSSRYENFRALDDISFEVPEGECLGIIGRNGCGKSTLLKMLAGIYGPSSGTIEISGRVSPFLELGVGFNPELTARENVYLSGSILGITRPDMRRRIDDVIEFAGLQHFADQKVKNFSSGMEVRLAFSVAIQAHAEILLMDEVLAVGDAEFQTKCFDVFDAYVREGRTVVLVTHSTAAVEQYCQRSILLDHGRILAQGPTGNVTSRYRRMITEEQEAQAMAAREAAGTAASEAGGRPLGASGHGTGDVRIEDVQLLDADGDEHHTFTNGQGMIIRVTMLVHRRVDDLICGVIVYRGDGKVLTGANNFQQLRLECPDAGERLVVDYRLGSLPLLAGGYRLTVGLAPRPASRPYDWHEQAYEFSVVDDGRHIGFFEFGGEWVVCSGDAGVAASQRGRVATPRG